MKREARGKVKRLNPRGLQKCSYPRRDLDFFSSDPRLGLTDGNESKRQPRYNCSAVTECVPVE